MRDEGAFTCSEVDPPIVSGTTIIVVAFIPLFTMTGDPGRIFAPKSLTCGFAWTGAFSMVVTPPHCALLLRGTTREQDTPLVVGVHRRYMQVLRWVLAHERIVMAIAGGGVVVGLGPLPLIGGELMPALAEGDIWMRTSMPVDISFERAARLAAGAGSFATCLRPSMRPPSEGDRPTAPIRRASPMPVLGRAQAVSRMAPVSEEQTTAH